MMCPRRRLLLAGALVLALAGCASPPPAARLYRLPTAVPLTEPPPAAPRPAGGEVWQLLAPVTLPEYLDRDALLLPEGAAGLRPLPGHRWAEPLRDALPRVLRADLATLLGADRVWTAPVPASVPITRQLRLEILALEATPDRAAVRLRARWVVLDPRPGAGTAPAVGEAEIEVRSGGSSVDALVVAHRLALWRLAQRIVGHRPAV